MGVGRVGDQEEGFGSTQARVHEGHGVFGIHIGPVAQSFDQGRCADLSAIVREQPRNDLSAYTGDTFKTLTGQCQTLVIAEASAAILGRVTGEPDDHLVEHLGSTPGDVEVPQGEGIE